MQNFLKPVETEIILQKNQILKLNELLIFPHGQDGFHIWEAGIILSRFVALNPQLFKNKTILELGTGVGIGGIAAAKFTECQKVIMSDYRDDIVQNIQKQMNKNSIKPGQIHDVINLNWLDYQNFNQKFDVIIGSDLIYAGAPVDALYNLIKKCMVQECYIVIPSQRHFAKNFLEIVDNDKYLQYEIIEIKQQEYFESPLRDEKQGFKTYPGLKELNFFIYKFSIIQQQQQQNQDQQ